MDNKRVLIIAEAGVNHNGSISTAKKLVDVAKECHADIVKFQTFSADKVVTKDARMAEYQRNNTGIAKSQQEMLKKLALSKEEFVELARYCSEVGISFLSTPFDVESIHFLNDLQNIWKVPSGEITNYPYLVEIAKTHKNVLLSTGMSTIEEVDEAIAVLKDNGTNDITLLHCTTNYPTLPEDVNLRAMLTLMEHCNCSVGYSDHTRGIAVPIAAVAMGANVIEKHFTLDRNMSGPDHKASLEPKELAEMILSIREIETALGDGIKRVAECERNNRELARKSIVAKKSIKAGEILSELNLTTKRPGTGVSPMKWNEYIGRAASRDYFPDEQIEL